MHGIATQAAKILEARRPTEGFPELSATRAEDEELFSAPETASLREALHLVVRKLSSLEDFSGSTLLEDVRFLISDSHSRPARIYEFDRKDQASTPIIVVSRHLLNLVQSEDELAFVLFHEIAHPKFRERFGFGTTLAPEEMNADGYAIKWMVQCGYNWREAETCLRRFMPIEGDQVEERATNFCDPHLHAADRIKTIHTGVGAWIIKNPGKTVPEPCPTPLEPSIHDDAAKLHREGFMEALAKAANFDSLPAAGKLQFLAEVLPYLELSNQAYSYETRRRQFLELLKKVPTGLQDAQTQERSHQLIDFAYESASYTDKEGRLHFGHSGFLSDLYPPIHKIITGEPPKRDYNKKLCPNSMIPIGRLRELDKHASAFVGAKTYEEALAAAQPLIDAHKEDLARLSGGGSLQLGHFQICNFPEPDRDKPLPWRPFIDWAVQDSSRAILGALRICDTVSTPDLWRALPLEELKQDNFLGDNFCLAAKSWRGHSDEYVSRRFQSYIKERIRAESPDVSIEEISTRLGEYLYKNEPSLRPPNNAVFEDFNPYEKVGLDLAWGGGEEKAEKLNFEATGKLVAQFEKLLSEDAPGARELVRGFFLARYHEPGFVGLVSLPVRFSQREYVSYPLDSPFARFFLEDKFKFFSIGEKVGLVDACHPKNKLSLDWWRKTLGYTPPESISEMTAFLADFRASVNGPLGHAFCAMELSDLFKRIPLVHLDPYSTEMARLYRQIDRVGAISSTSGDEPKKFRNELAALFLNQEKTRRGPIDLCPGLALDEMLSFFRFVDYNGFIPSPEARQSLCARIIQEFSHLSDPQEKSEQICDVLSDPSAARDVRLRRYCIDTWVSLHAQALGPDDGTEDYSKRVDETLKELKDRFGHRTVYDMAMKLADAIVAQRALSYHIRDTLGARVTDSLYALHGEIKGAYTLVEFLRSDKEGRLSLLEFLTAPLNSSSVDTLADAINKSGYSAELGKYAIKANLTYRFYEDLGVYGGDHDSEQRALRMALWDLHANFWEQPPEARTLILDTILVPPGDFVKDKKAAYVEASEVVLDGLFKVFKGGDLRAALKHPLVAHIVNNTLVRSSRQYAGQEDPLNVPVIQRAISAVYTAFAKPADNDPLERRNAWGRLFANTYLEDCHDTERPLLLAAVMAAAEQTGQHPEKSAFGQRLAALLGWLGPAYRKLGQALHSSSATPEDVRVPCGELKGRAQNISRPHLFDLIDRDVPAEARERIKWVGPIAGNASFFVTVKIRYLCDDGVERDQMLSLLAPNAREDAEKGFTRLENTGRKLAAGEPAFAPIADVILEMVRQAREMCRVETDLDLGAQQAGLAAAQYRGMSVIVNRRRFKFHQASWTSHGELFRITDCADGAHFNDLPEGTSEERKYKHDLAVAVASVELLNILRGQEFDCDRHGAQLRAKGSKCGMYDHGGMTLTAPSAEEKKQLASVLWKIFASRGTRDPGTALFEEVARIQRETSQRPDYLMKVQKAFLALNDFFRYLTADDFTAVTKAVVLSGEIDSVFLRELGKKALFSGSIFGLLARSKGASIHIERI